MKYLSEELIINILLRLPVKSLLRFKSVSKLWFSLISDPSFANSHFHRSSFPDRLLYKSSSQVRSIDFNSSFYDDSSVVQLHFPITPPPPYFQIWGSCRGFVLLDDFHSFIVWNPSTGSYKRLPYSPMPSQFSPFLHSLGYDASNDDYLVVLAAYDPNYVNFASHFQFFSMKANSWKKIENFPYSNNIVESGSCSFLNGAIHWLVSRHDTSLDVILAFNVTERNFHEITQPDDFDGFSGSGCCILETLGECLSLCVLGNDTADIWMMKEYGMKSSWTKYIAVSLVDIPTDFFFPIGLTQSGEIVGSDSFTRLLKYDEKGEVVESVSYDDKGYEAVTYTETLLSLPSGNE